LIVSIGCPLIQNYLKASEQELEQKMKKIWRRRQVWLSDLSACALLHAWPSLYHLTYLPGRMKGRGSKTSFIELIFPPSMWAQKDTKSGAGCVVRVIS
jgi:hypothetical protein